MRRLTLVLALLLCGCEGRTPDTRERAAQTAGWSIDSLPTVSIGTEEGESTEQLYYVNGAVRLANGTIVVANAGTYELRYYDAAGRFLHAAGRKGQGPGEFTSLGPIAAAGDTVFAFDYESLHVSAYDAQGSLARSTLLATPDSFFPPAFLGRLADGRLLGSSRRIWRTPPALANGLRRDSVTLWLFAADGRPLQPLGRYAGKEEEFRLMGGNGAKRGIAITTHPFYRNFITVAAGDRIYAGETDTAALLVFDSGMMPLPPLHWSASGIVPPGDLLKQYERYELARLEKPEYAPMVRRDVPNIPLPERLPVFSTVVVDDGGSVWIREFDPPWTGESRWLVFAPGSNTPAHVNAPRGLNITAAGSDWVLGIVEDELGVQYVRLHRLHRLTS